MILFPRSRIRYESLRKLKLILYADFQTDPIFKFSMNFRSYTTPKDRHDTDENLQKPSLIVLSDASRKSTLMQSSSSSETKAHLVLKHCTNFETDPVSKIPLKTKLLTNLKTDPLKILHWSSRSDEIPPSYRCPSVIRIFTFLILMS